MIKNKKAQEELEIVLVAILIIIVSIVIALAFSFSHSKTKLEIKENIENYEDESLFLSYLRTPYENVTIADKLAYYYINQTNKNELVKPTVSIFNKVFHPNTCWEINIDTNKFLEYTEHCEGKEIKHFSALIPAFNEQGSLDVELVIW